MEAVWQLQCFTSLRYRAGVLLDQTGQATGDQVPFVSTCRIRAAPGLARDKIVRRCTQAGLDSYFCRALQPARLDASVAEL